ncbi:MAG TPA: hypothetical protein VKG38_17860 [Solirubrobacteraceae bacterium]|nr:hypothetical protein [Solirubrobacteraceae bacterium]
MARSLQSSGHWGYVVDSNWRIVYVTDELRLTFGGNTELAIWPIGAHTFGPEMSAAAGHWRFGTTTEALVRSNFAAFGGWVLADTPGGRDQLRELVDPVLRDMVDDLLPADSDTLWGSTEGIALSSPVRIPWLGIRLRYPRPARRP